MSSDCCPKSLTHQPEITSVHMLSQQHVITPHDAFSREITSFFMHVISFFKNANHIYH